MKDFIVPDRSHLVAEYLLNGDALDTSGSGNNGTATNVTYVNTDRGYQSQCGVFNGSSGQITDTSTYFTGDFTVMCWFKKQSTSYQFLVGTNGFSNNQRLSVDTKLSFAMWSGFQTILLGNTTLSNDVWYHGVAVKSSNTVTLYLNGVSDGSLGFPSQNDSTLTIGGQAVYNQLLFNGNIQSVRIFNVALPETEIRNWYLEGLRALGGASLHSLMDGLVAYYDMRGDANDIVGGRNGTVSGATLTTDFYGNANSAYSFNGSSSVISGITNWGITSKFAAVILTKSSNWAQAAGAFFGIENKTPNNGAPSWGVFTSAGLTKMFLNKSYVIGIGNSNTLTLSNDTYYVFGVSYDGTTATFYQDGVAVGTATSTQTFNTDNVMAIGRDGLTTSWFLGQHDRLIIFKDVTKSATEMKALNDLICKDGNLIPFE